MSKNDPRFAQFCTPIFGPFSGTPKKSTFDFSFFIENQKIEEIPESSQTPKNGLFVKKPFFCTPARTNFEGSTSLQNWCVPVYKTPKKSSKIIKNRLQLPPKTPGISPGSQKRPFFCQKMTFCGGFGPLFSKKSEKWSFFAVKRRIPACAQCAETLPMSLTE